MDGSLCCRNYGIPGLGGESSARPHPLSLAIPRLTLGLLFVACLSIVTISVTGPFVSLLFCLWSERVIVEVPLFGRTITSRYLFGSNTIESEICCSLTTGLFVAFMATVTASGAKCTNEREGCSFVWISIVDAAVHGERKFAVQTKSERFYGRK